MEDAARGQGRPRVWAGKQARQQAYRARRSQRTRLVDDLLDAVRNAAWEDRELQATINHGDDLEVLAALIAYYRARHWMLRQGQPSKS
jgi:hypothetical protein